MSWFSWAKNPTRNKIDKHGMRWLEYRGHTIRIWALDPLPNRPKWNVAPIEPDATYYMGPPCIEGDNLEELVAKAKSMINGWVEYKKEQEGIKTKTLEELNTFSDPDLEDVS